MSISFEANDCAPGRKGADKSFLFYIKQDAGAIQNMSGVNIRQSERNTEPVIPVYVGAPLPPDPRPRLSTVA